MQAKPIPPSELGEVSSVVSASRITTNGLSPTNGILVRYVVCSGFKETKPPILDYLYKGIVKKRVPNLLFYAFQQTPSPPFLVNEKMWELAQKGQDVLSIVPDSRLEYLTLCALARLLTIHLCALHCIARRRCWRTYLTFAVFLHTKHSVTTMIYWKISPLVLRLWSTWSILTRIMADGTFNTRFCPSQIMRYEMKFHTSICVVCRQISFLKRIKRYIEVG